jgi:predicted RNA-binding Zn-ribbon protein involved in translation (DUF1610 family)
VYDGLTGRYTFRCPEAGEARVRLSRFRSLDRLPGPSHPAVYRVRFACPCGEEHAGLVSHDELDWAPLGAAADDFLNLMTGRLEPARDELLALAAARIGAGEWPWSFFCYPEGRPRPVFPSAFRLLAAAEERVGLAVRCPDCGGTSVNVVTHRHVDEPFYNDADVGVVEHVFGVDADALVAAFRAELDSGAFDARRLGL